MVFGLNSAPLANSSMVNRAIPQAGGISAAGLLGLNQRSASPRSRLGVSSPLNSTGSAMSPSIMSLLSQGGSRTAQKAGLGRTSAFDPFGTSATTSVRNPLSRSINTAIPTNQPAVGATGTMTIQQALEQIKQITQLMGVLIQTLLQRLQGQTPGTNAPNNAIFPQGASPNLTPQGTPAPGVQGANTAKPTMTRADQVAGATDMTNALKDSLAGKPVAKRPIPTASGGSVTISKDKLGRTLLLDMPSKAMYLVKKDANGVNFHQVNKQGQINPKPVANPRGFYEKFLRDRFTGLNTPNDKTIPHLADCLFGAHPVAVPASNGRGKSGGSGKSRGSNGSNGNSQAGDSGNSQQSDGASNSGSSGSATQTTPTETAPVDTEDTSGGAVEEEVEEPTNSQGSAAFENEEAVGGQETSLYEKNLEERLGGNLASEEDFDKAIEAHKNKKKKQERLTNKDDKMTLLDPLASKKEKKEAKVRNEERLEKAERKRAEAKKAAEKKAAEEEAEKRENEGWGRRITRAVAGEIVVKAYDKITSGSSETDNSSA